jgi:hypothetical protein
MVNGDRQFRVLRMQAAIHNEGTQEAIEGWGVQGERSPFTA